MDVGQREERNLRPIMPTAFDQYRDDYQDQVQGAISFIKWDLDYYIEQKV